MRGWLSWCRLTGWLCSPQNPVPVRGLSQECSRQLGTLRGGFLADFVMSTLILSLGVSGAHRSYVRNPSLPRIG